MMMHDISYILLMFVMVIGLILLTAAMMKKFQPSKLFHKNNLGEPRRLLLEETLILDQQNKIILIKRDDVRHLLMVGRDKSIIIETGIKL